jgi:hypothetical protein
VPANEPNEAWRIPPELQQPVPRRIRLTGTGMTYCVLAAASIVFAVGMTAKVGLDELHRQAVDDSLSRRLTVEGHDADATVTSLQSSIVFNRVTYDYTVDGRSYEGSFSVAPEHWQSLQVGSPLAVRYLPTDPARAYPAADLPNSREDWKLVLPLAGLILFFMPSFAAIYLSLVLPQRRLLAHGKPAQGTVTRYKEGSRGRSSGYYLYYDFSPPEGSRCQGKAFRSQPMAEGSTVTVLYDPSSPRRNALYPLETVRLAAI